MSTEGTAAVEKEIAQEKADSLTLAARRLEAALGELRDYDAVAKLEGISKIAMVRFSAADVVRHPLVGKIVEAYEGKGA